MSMFFHLPSPFVTKNHTTVRTFHTKGADKNIFGDLFEFFGQNNVLESFFVGKGDLWGSP
jgi:hypothetical protein